MNRKQYLTSLFNRYQEENMQLLEQFYNKQPHFIEDIVLIFPYLLAANYYYVPGFKKELPSLSIFHFRMDDNLKNKLAIYLNIKEINSISSQINSDIIAIYLYDDISSENDLNFIVFYDTDSISVSSLEYLKNKIIKLNSWFKNRFKVKVEISLFSNKNRTIFYLSSSLAISIFDFYTKTIHIKGKYSYKFLLNKRITPMEFLENKKEILTHNWLNESLFFSLPHFKPTKDDLQTIIKFYINNTLNISFQNFHKLLYYHSLYSSQDITKYFNREYENKFFDELNLIKKESGLDFEKIANLEFMILLQDKNINILNKEKIKMKFYLFEFLNFDSNYEKDYEIKVLKTNSDLIKFLNLFFSIYKITDNPISKLLRSSTSNIEYHNLLKHSFSSERLIIMFLDGEWGLYIIKYINNYQKFKKLFSKKSLIELLIFSIYNQYIINIIPTIKNKSNNILDENNYFNRLKNKLIKYNILFSSDDYLKSIENRIDEIEGIFIFLNFSINNKLKNIKDYTYVSEQWDPLNYGYQKKSNISEIALIVKTKSQKVHYYEYKSDQAILLAIQHLYSQTYRYNPNVEITINIFDIVLSASIIFRLKKLFNNSYEIFSYKNSMFLTSYNGNISLLKKEDNSISIIPYEDEQGFFNMLKEETISLNYMIDEDVLELSHFSKVVKTIKLNSIDIFFMVMKEGNWIYVFDEENQFYFFKNISLNFLRNIVELALNHRKHITSVNSIELYNIEEKELNDYNIISISTDNFKKINSSDKKYNLLVEGSANGDNLILNYKINNTVFKYKEFKDKTFFKMIRFIKLSNLNKIKITTLHTSYFQNGKRYYNFKFKLKLFEILNKKIKEIKEKYEN